MSLKSITRLVRTGLLVLTTAVAVGASADEVAGVRLPCVGSMGSYPMEGPG